jgi:hypothetical protein
MACYICKQEVETVICPKCRHAVCGGCLVDETCSVCRTSAARAETLRLREESRREDYRSLAARAKANDEYIHPVIAESRSKSGLSPADVKTIWTVIVVVCIGIFMFKGCLTNPASTDTSAEALAIDTKIAAYAMAKGYILENLKAPSTAKFGFYGEYPDPGCGVRDNGDNTFTCQGYVDSQNSFGAMIRTRWICTVRHTGAGDSDWVQDGQIVTDGG